MKKVFVITGEYSGDIHGGKVISLLKEQYPEIIVEGIGGENLKNAGTKQLLLKFAKFAVFPTSRKSCVYDARL